MTAADLRSDTLTRPTDAMRRAMAAAEVGDDMFGEDPTVRRLEERFCEITGKEAAVFVPSGTMANQLAIRSQTEPGDEIITHPESHIVHYEAGGVAALSGLMLRYADGPRGTFFAEDLAGLVRPDDPHCTITKLVTIENTHNRGGGRVWPVEQLHAVIAEAHRLGLRVHIDGARIWNASVASGVAVGDLVRGADTISACFSKGLGAPVGSALAGDNATIKRARRFRKMFGGAMRQAGVLAAGAIYALESHVQRLEEDHARARSLAEMLADVPGINVNPGEIDTNLVFFDTDPERAAADAICDRCASDGVMMFSEGPARIRAVTHLDLGPDAIPHAAAVIRRAVQAV